MPHVLHPYTADFIALQLRPCTPRLLANALCFFAFHAPVAMRAAYSELYLIQIGRPRARVLEWAHWSARVNATRSARF